VTGHPGPIILYSLRSEGPEVSRSRLLPVALACLFFTAGCLGFPGGGTPTTPDAGPASPALSPTASPPPGGDSAATATPSSTPVPAELPSNVLDSGVGSPRRVADTHDATLRNTSFTVQFSRVRIVDGEVDVRLSGVVRYDGAGTVYSNITRAVFDTGSASRQRFERWSNGTVGRRAIVTANGTAIEDAEPIADVPTYADRVAIYLRSFRTSVAGWSRLGGTLITRASGVRLLPPSATDRRSVGDFGFTLGFEEIESGELSVDVTERAVRRYVVRLVGRSSFSSVVWEEELRFTRLGVTTVDRPTWVAAANESRTPT